MGNVGICEISLVRVKHAAQTLDEEMIPTVMQSIIISSCSHFKTDLWDCGEKRFPHKQPHLSVSLDLGVHKCPQNVGCDWKVDEDELCLLMKAEQGEVVPQLHRLNGIFLLLTEEFRKG